MTTNWFGGPTTPSDPNTFDYDTALQKVQRQRAAAQALQQMGMQGNQGQFVKNGDFIGYAGGNTLGSTMARVAAGLLSVKANDNADDSQRQLGQDSQNALAYALDPNNSVAAKRAAAQQTQIESDAADQRELNRMSNAAQDGDGIGPQEAQDGPSAIQTSPVPVPHLSDITPIPMAPTLAQAAAKVLGKPSAGAPAGASATVSVQGHASIPVTGGPQSFGTGADLSRTLAPKANLPTNTTGPLSADEATFAARMFGGAPVANTSRKPQGAPQASAAPSSTPALPAIPAQGTALPSAAPVAQAPLVQPMPPQASSLEDRARALGMDPTAPRGPGDPSLAQQVQAVEATQNQMARGVNVTGDPRSMVEQAAARGNASASFGDQMANLQKIARTGPMGQQLASATMQSQFSKDWGEIKNADGATVGVYNKRNPSETQAFNGVGVGSKSIETMSNLIKSTDPSNPDAVSRLNQTLGAMGIPPMTADQVRGMGMTNDQRMTVSKGHADSISAITQRRGEAAAQVADLGKINSDLQYAMSIANDAAGRYSGISGAVAQWFGGGQQQQTLNRILNDSMLMSIMQDKGGQGTAGVGLMQAYQQHGLKATMQPEALQQGLQQIQAAVQQRVAAKQAELQAHDYALDTLGYHPQQQTQQAGTGATPNGRAPGNYSF
jgi:hypothetical protein